MYMYFGLFCTCTYIAIRGNIIVDWNRCLYISAPTFLQKEGVNMPLSENQKQARYTYAKKSLKRIPLDVQKEEYEQIKAAADAAEESVNGYIKQAIRQRMQRDAE